MTKKGYLFVAILTLITVVLWVIFDVLHSQSEVKTPPDIEKLIEPLDPTFDLKGIE